MFCRNCGKELPDGAVFCSRCGMKLEEMKERAGYNAGEFSETDKRVQNYDRLEDGIAKIYSMVKELTAGFQTSLYIKCIKIAAIVSLASGVMALGWFNYVIISLLAGAGLLFLCYKRQLDNTLYMAIVFSVYAIRSMLADINMIIDSAGVYEGYVYILRVLVYGMAVVFWLLYVGRIEKRTGRLLVITICAALCLCEVLYMIIHLSGYFRTIMVIISDAAFCAAYVFWGCAEISGDGKI